MVHHRNVGLRNTGCKERRREGTFRERLSASQKLALRDLGAPAMARGPLARGPWLQIPLPVDHNFRPSSRSGTSTPTTAHHLYFEETEHIPLPAMASYNVAGLPWPISISALHSTQARLLPSSKQHPKQAENPLPPQQLAAPAVTHPYSTGRRLHTRLRHSSNGRPLNDCSTATPGQLETP